MARVPAAQSWLFTPSMMTAESLRSAPAAHKPAASQSASNRIRMGLLDFQLPRTPVVGLQERLHRILLHGPVLLVPIQPRLVAHCEVRQLARSGRAHAGF